MPTRYNKYEKMTIIYVVFMIDYLLWTFGLSTFGYDNRAYVEVLPFLTIPAVIFLAVMTARCIKWIVHFIWVYSPAKFRKYLKQKNAEIKLQRAIRKELDLEINKVVVDEFAALSKSTKSKRK